MQYRKLTEIKKFDNNPRYIKKEDMDKLVKSIKNNPDYFEARPIILSDRTGELIIIAGNQRYEAAKIIGLTEVPTYLLKDLTQEREKEIMIRDNVSNGEWDWELLSSQFEKEELEDWGLDIDKWKEDDIVEDEVPEVTENPVSKLGEVYQLGRHRIMCGDSTKIEDVEKLMDGKKADMVFTDPPYNFETQGGGVLKNSRQMNQVKDNGVDKFDTTKLFPLAKTHVYFHNKSLIGGYIELSKLWNMSYDLAIYKKQGLPNYKGHLMTDVEYIAIIGNLDPNKGLPFEMYSKVFNGKKDNDNELSYSKPVELCAKFIKLYSNNLVLDLFLGSGSTIIACEQTNRICYGMEISPAYIDVCRKRYAKFINSEDWESVTPKIL